MAGPACPRAGGAAVAEAVAAAEGADGAAAAAGAAAVEAEAGAEAEACDGSFRPLLLPPPLLPLLLPG